MSEKQNNPLEEPPPPRYIYMPNLISILAVFAKIHFGSYLSTHKYAHTNEVQQPNTVGKYQEFEVDPKNIERTKL
jgi:hypothetical protein